MRNRSTRREHTRNVSLPNLHSRLSPLDPLHTRAIFNYGNQTRLNYMDDHRISTIMVELVNFADPNRNQEQDILHLNASFGIQQDVSEMRNQSTRREHTRSVSLPNLRSRLSPLDPFHTRAIFNYGNQTRLSYMDDHRISTIMVEPVNFADPNRNQEQDIPYLNDSFGIQQDVSEIYDDAPENREVQLPINNETLQGSNSMNIIESKARLTNSQHELVEDSLGFHLPTFTVQRTDRVTRIEENQICNNFSSDAMKYHKINRALLRNLTTDQNILSHEQQQDIDNYYVPSEYNDERTLSEKLLERYTSRTNENKKKLSGKILKYQTSDGSIIHEEFTKKNKPANDCSLRGTKNYQKVITDNKDFFERAIDGFMGLFTSKDVEKKEALKNVS